MIHWFRSSLTVQLVSVSTLILCIPIVFGLTYFPSQQKKSTMESITQYVETRCLALAASTGFAMKNANFDLVNYTFRDALTDPSFVYVAVLDENNEILVDSARNYTADKKTVGKTAGNALEGIYLTITRDSKYEGTKYGRVVVTYSLEKSNAELSSGVTTGYMLNVLILLVGVLLIFLFMRRFTNRIRKDAEAETKYLDASVNQMLSAMEAFGRGEATNALVTERDDTIAKLFGAYNILTNRVHSLISEVEKSSDRSRRQQEYLSASINHILTAMEQFALGDLTVSIPVETDDEIGRLFDGFNRAVTNIRNLVLQVNSAIESAASVATELSAASTEMAATAEDQSRQSRTIANSVVDMSQTISENTKQSVKARDQANEALDAVKASGERVRSLTQSSQEIGEIISLIRDITDQTNLLALNAAIEAARAGEAGRGFSVVADEVRKLSERTHKATKDIQDKIRQIQDESAGTSETLQIISKRTENVTTTILTVSQASEAQARTSHDIALNIEGLSSASIQMSGSIGEIARTIEDLSRLTADLQSVIGNFSMAGNDSHSRHSAPKQLRGR